MVELIETREKLVESLFHGTGPSYDEMVKFATWGHDRRWKEDLLGRMEKPRRVLDLASGTGILTFEIARRFGCHVTGVELREEYCQEARGLAERAGLDDVRFVVAPAEHFLVDETFDHVTTCYLPKYVSRLDVLVEHMVRMLEPGGIMLMQDFAYPDDPRWQTLFEHHFDRMRAKAREEAPGWLTMFEGLPDVIRSSKWKANLVLAMQAQGMVDIRVTEQSVGLSALVSARRPVN